MTTKYDWISGLSAAEVRALGSTPEIAAFALIAWELKRGSGVVEPDEQERRELIEEVRRFAFPTVRVGVAAQGLLHCWVGDEVEVMVQNKNRRWMAGLRGTVPTVDVTNVIHDKDGLANALRDVVAQS